MGKGLTGSRSLHRKPSPDTQGRDNWANLTAGNSRWCNIAEARLSEELGAIIPHAEICAGGGWVTALPTATALCSTHKAIEDACTVIKTIMENLK